MDPTIPLKLVRTCVQLRHKMMYVDDRQAIPGMVDDQSDTRIFWCGKTMDALGPDGRTISPSACAPTRTCFCASEDATNPRARA